MTESNPKYYFPPDQKAVARILEAERDYKNLNRLIHWQLKIIALTIFRGR